MKNLIEKAWVMLLRPDVTLDNIRDESPSTTLGYLAVFALWLGVMTALTNLVGSQAN